MKEEMEYLENRTYKECFLLGIKMAIVVGLATFSCVMVLIVFKILILKL